MPSPRRIDIHFHLIPQFYQDAVYEAGAGPAIGRYPDWSPELALELMDKSGIEVALMSLAQPGVQFGDPNKAAALARRCNEYSAELNARWPKRFGSLATVPMWRRREAVAEIDHSLGQLKHHGVCLFASYGEKFLGDPWFDPVLAALNDRAAVVFVHPALHPSSRTLELPWPGFMMEYVFDTTRAAVNLVFSGAHRALSAHPLRAGACRRADAVFRLAAFGVADDRQAARADAAGRRSMSGCGASGTTTRSRRPPRPLNASRAWRGRTRSCSAATGRSRIRRVIAEAVRTYEGVAMPQEQRDAIDRNNALSLFPQFA